MQTKAVDQVVGWCWLISSLSGWLDDWLGGWVIEWLGGWVGDWLGDWLIDSSVGGLVGWLVPIPHHTHSSNPTPHSL